MICKSVSSLLPIVIPVTLGNRDDSNRDDIKNEKKTSHLLCFLEAKA